MPPPRRQLPLRHAIALGLAQGPTELLPVSSSAHTALIPWLLGWRYDELDADWRKSFEVALHAGGGLALAIAMRGRLAGALRVLDRRRGAVLLLSLAPASLTGLLLRRGIASRLGAPRAIAVALVTGAGAMALADSGPPGGRRELQEAGPGDGLALGLAQALALIPGVSRSGATLAAARARGFGRRDAQTLSWESALPVILGASSFESVRLARRGLPAGALGPMAAGASAAFASTLLSARLLGREQTPGEGHVLLPYALYRCVLASVVLRRLGSAHNRCG